MTDQQVPASLHSLAQRELLALALDASKRGDSGNALIYLKESAARGDATSSGLFMLGSEYAQLGLIAEAKDCMARAVELDPGFPIARFQLGMLILTTGDMQAACDAWEPLLKLDDTGPQAYLAHFAYGMRHLVADDFVAALQALRQGISLNLDNEPLNADMARLVATVERSAGSGTTAVPVSPSQADSEAGAELNHLFISTYAKSGLPH